MTVRLAEAAPVTGGLLFELLAVEGRSLPTPPRGAAKGAPRRKLVQRRIKRAGRGQARPARARLTASDTAS